ncbi:MAG: hypothetical protein O7H41_11420 [Planctomycetota bacterium]|nr:hypothetical protein [Planctomycetota bacterium]
MGSRILTAATVVCLILGSWAVGCASPIRMQGPLGLQFVPDESAPVIEGVLLPGPEDKAALFGMIPQHLDGRNTWRYTHFVIVTYDPIPLGRYWVPPPYDGFSKQSDDGIEIRQEAGGEGVKLQVEFRSSSAKSTETLMVNGMEYDIESGRAFHVDLRRDPPKVQQIDIRLPTIVVDNGFKVSATPLESGPSIASCTRFGDAVGSSVEFALVSLRE